MIGRFLEFSVATPDIAASFDFYSRLGFVPLPVGDAWTHPYAVLSDGRVHLGLHAAALDTPQLTFMRPKLLQAADALGRLGIDVDVRKLGNDEFNELGWRDPGGHRLRLVEARTFSPPPETPPASLCGHFLEVALPEGDSPATRLWWEQLGFIALDEADGRPARVCCISDTVNVGLYAPRDIPAATLVFEADDLAALRVRLADAGFQPERQVPRGLIATGTLVLVAPEGTPLVIYPAAAD